MNQLRRGLINDTISNESTSNSSDQLVIEVENSDVKENVKKITIHTVSWYIVMVIVRTISIPVIIISTICIWVVGISLFIICYCIVLITFIVITPITSLLCYIFIGNTVYSDKFLSVIQHGSIGSYKYLTTPLYSSRFNYFKCGDGNDKKDDN